MGDGPTADSMILDYCLGPTTGNSVLAWRFFDKLTRDNNVTTTPYEHKRLLQHISNHVQNLPRRLAHIRHALGYRLPPRGVMRVGSDRFRPN